MEFIKKQGIGFYATAVAVILAIVSMILYCVNATTAYYNDLDGGLVAMAVIGVLLGLAAVVIPQFSFAENKYVQIGLAAVRVAFCVLMICFGVMFLKDRVESLGYIFGSNLELGNDAAFAAGSQAITCAIMFIVTWLVACVGSFFHVVKPAEN